MDLNTQIAKAFQDCKNKSINKITTCFYPGCKERSINSHILQKNGIISTIAENGHVYEIHINPYRKEEGIYFKRIGINDAFSFNCFCNNHDRDLFKPIEIVDVNYSNYTNCLLFTLRTIYNEKFRKMVNVGMYESMLESHSNLFDYNKLHQSVYQEKLGLSDIERTEKLIWDDLNNNSESFVFKVKNINRKEICLSAFYNYETSDELKAYALKYKKNKKTVIMIFYVNLFPYKESSVFMMAYKKEDELTVKGYVNEFFADNEKRLERKITNLLMFQCETWIISNKFYQKNIKGNDSFFRDAVLISRYNNNERRVFEHKFISTRFP